jgi:hypothetical protein
MTVLDRKWELIYGQLINMMASLVLPWSFIMLQSGSRDSFSKINAISFTLVFFVVLVFPIYYFFQLVLEKKRQLIQRRQDELSALQFQDIRKTSIDREQVNNAERQKTSSRSRRQDLKRTLATKNHKNGSSLASNPVFQK